MDNYIRFHCPACRKRLKAPPAYVGRVVRCTRPGCGITLRVPGEVLDLDDDADEVIELGPRPLDLDGPFEGEPLSGPRARRARGRRVSLETVLGVAALVFLAAGVYGVYWWVGQPSAEQVAVYEGFVRTSNELMDMHDALTDAASAKAAEPKLMAKAAENLEFIKQRHAMPKGRKKDKLEARFRPEIDTILKRVTDLIMANKPILILPSTTDKGEYVILKNFFEVVTSTGGKGQASGGTTPTTAERVAKLAGTWEADALTLVIEPDGSGYAEVVYTDGVTYGTRVGRFTVAVKNGEPTIAYTLDLGNKKTDYEFTVLPGSSANALVMKEAAGRVAPNPITLTRRSKEQAKTQEQPPKIGNPAPPVRPTGTTVSDPVASEATRSDETAKESPTRPAAGTPAFSDLKVTRTTFDPPSVEFTIRLDRAGGKLLEAWASVGIADAGPTLDIFAGAVYKGLLEVNGINFLNPDPALKAQIVSMTPSATDPTLYVCTVRYPKLVLDDPATEFTIVAAVEKDKTIVKTNAATVNVNLKTGTVTGAKK